MLDNNYVWTATGTDITIRWKNMGWIPPSEMQGYKDKWRYYQNLPLRHLDDIAKVEYENVLKRNKITRVK
jgi:hypothetical protein